MASVFDRIVVPTDFSECAEQAWALAQRVAVALGSEVVLLHVFVEPPVYGEPPETAGGADVFEHARKWVEGELGKWAARARDGAVRVRTMIRVGAADEEIVALATDERADLVIMGTHGRSGMNRLLLGSVADRVIRQAPCPVLTVRTPE